MTNTVEHTFNGPLASDTENSKRFRKMCHNKKTKTIILANFHFIGNTVKEINENIEYAIRRGKHIKIQNPDVFISNSIVKYGE